MGSIYYQVTRLALWLAIMIDIFWLTGDLSLIGLKMSQLCITMLDAILL